MNARRYQRKRGVKRVFVTLLTFVMLLSVCFPGLSARAEGEEGTVPPESTVAPTETVPETTAPAETQPDITEGENVPGETQPVMAPNAGGGIAPAADDGIAPAAEQPLPDAVPGNKLQNPDSSIFLVPGKSKDIYSSVTQLYSYKIYDENGQLTTMPDVTVSLSGDEVSVGVPGTMPYGKFYVAISMQREYWFMGTHTEDVVRYVLVEVGEYDPSELKQSNVEETHIVYWDATNGSAHSTDSDKIKTVKLGNAEVTWADSSDSKWSGGKSLKEHYGEGVINHEKIEYTTLSIDPVDGYYVTDLLIVCAQNYPGPYECGINDRGNAFGMSFGVGTAGTLEVQIPTVAFGHGQNDYEYFILIKVSAVPSPLFIEYDYGNIDELGITSPVFDSPETWLTASDANDYETGGIVTKYTQFKYTYDVPENVVNWKHTANKMNEEAKAAAIAAGYYFAGWDTTYYNNCTEDFQFSNVYNPEPVLIQENAPVRMITHARMVAKWLPIELNVTKAVSGVPANNTTDLTYTIDILEDGKPFDTLTVTADADGFYTTTYSAAQSGNQEKIIKPGSVYTIQETNNGGSVAVGGSTYYPTVSYSPNTVTAVQGTSSLMVINSYVAAEPALKFVKIWQDPNGEPSNAPADVSSVTLEVSYTDANGDAQKKIITIKAEDNWIAYDYELDPASITGVVENPIPTGYTATIPAPTVEHVASTTEGTPNYMYTVYTAINKLTMADVTLTKSVTGNMGDWSKEFTFTITGVDGTVTLKHNGTKTFSAPIGSTVTITESGNDGYKVTATVNGQPVDVVNGAITFTVSADGNAIVFINNKEAQIDTGLAADSTPFAVLFAVAALGAVLLLKKRRTAF